MESLSTRLNPPHIDSLNPLAQRWTRVRFTCGLDLILHLLCMGWVWLQGRASGKSGWVVKSWSMHVHQYGFFWLNLRRYIMHYVQSAPDCEALPGFVIESWQLDSPPGAFISSEQEWTELDWSELASINEPTEALISFPLKQWWKTPNIKWIRLNFFKWIRLNVSSSETLYTEISVSKG